MHNILSMPIWFNHQLNTKFDEVISQAGFNFMKDLFPKNQLIIGNFNGLGNNKIRKLKTIIKKIPGVWRTTVEQSENIFITVNPVQTVNLNGCDVYIKNLESQVIYNWSISNKIRLPTGILRWCEEIDLSDTDIKNGFFFARACTQSVFDQVFQYKILTQILPTNYYLKRYLIKDSDICSKCLIEKDTVLHNLWLCPCLVPYVTNVIKFLKNTCNVKDDIALVTYFFGFQNNVGLNHILIELKKEIFYNWNINVSVNVFCERFLAKLRNIIIKEKKVMFKNDSYDLFYTKWINFRDIYDFLGPDFQIIH